MDKKSVGPMLGSIIIILTFIAAEIVNDGPKWPTTECTFVWSNQRVTYNKCTPGKCMPIEFTKCVVNVTSNNEPVDVPLEWRIIPIPGKFNLSPDWWWTPMIPFASCSLKHIKQIVSSARVQSDGTYIAEETCRRNGTDVYLTTRGFHIHAEKLGALGNSRQALGIGFLLLIPVIIWYGC